MNVVMSSFGFVVVGEAPAEGYRNVLITGLGRSGTSAIASVLRNAGFYLGDVENISTREDPALREMLRKGQINEILTLLADWAASHPLIAWKEPKLVGNEGRQLVCGLPDDWAVIVVFRDPLARAVRLVTEHGGDLMTTLVESIRLPNKLVQLVQETQKTTLLLSYEKHVTKPIDVCQDLLSVLVPKLTLGIDVPALWNKTRMDQSMYQEHAERKRRKEFSRQA